MPRHSALPAALLAHVAIVTASPAAAQSALSLDVTVGGSRGLGGGERRDRTTPAVDAVLAWRPRRGGGGPVVGVSANVQGTTGTLALDRGRDGQFVVSFPAFASVGPLGGWETGGRRGAALRALAGPAYFREYNAGEGTVGAHARLDAATSARFHVALVGSLRGALLRYRGATLGMTALGVGLRVQ